MKKISVTVIDREGEKHDWTGTGCIVTVVDRGKDGEIENLATALLGQISDHELLMMLRYTLDKMQETLEDKNLADTPIDAHLQVMRDSMIAEAKGSILMEDHDTVQ